MELIFRIESIQSDKATAQGCSTDPASKEGFFQESNPNDTFAFSPLGGLIGRSAECDWVLTDLSRCLSGKHASISFEDQQFLITDISTNGLFVNGSRDPLGKGNKHVVVSGDQFLMGIYRLSASVEVSSGALPDRLDSIDSLTGNKLDRAVSLASHEYFMEDSAGDLSDALTLPTIDYPTAVVEDRDDKNIPISENEAYDDFDQQEVQCAIKEHSDWDDDSLAPLSGEPLSSGDSTIVDRPLTRDVPPAFSISATSDVSNSDVPNSDVPNSDVPNSDVPASDHRLVRHFLKGAGLDEGVLSHGNDVQLMTDLGCLLKSYTEEMMGLLGDRGRYKNKCRLDMTLVSSLNNNPLKYCVNETQALREMVITPQRENLSGVDAIKSAASDMREHFARVERGYQGTINSVIDYMAIGQQSTPDMAGYSSMTIRGGQASEPGSVNYQTPTGWWQYRKLIKLQQRKKDILSDNLFHENPFLAPRFSHFYQQDKSLQCSSESLAVDGNLQQQGESKR